LTIVPINNPQISMEAKPVRDAAKAGTAGGPPRDVTIDVLRGLAIVMMVAANLAAAALAQPHPFWFRLYGSFAAPLFVLLSGMIVAYTTRRKGYGLGHFLARGAMIIVVAALLEVLIWKFYPFMSVDVLYLIGVSIPLSHLALRLSTAARWVIIAGIFLGTPILQHVLGYADYPTEVSLSRDPSVVIADPTNVVSHWLMDGWFPLFPWLGFALLGVQLAGLRVRQSVRARGWVPHALFIGAAVFACGVLTWCLHPGALLVRGGYSELFYPPTPGFIMTAIGLAIVLLATIDWKPDLHVYLPLRLLGESALWMYVLHIAMIKYVLAPAWPEATLGMFVVLYAGVVLGLLVVACARRGVKARWRHPPFPVRMLLGN
jgi:uncharacterized membrane protein